MFILVRLTQTCFEHHYAHRQENRLYKHFTFFSVLQAFTLHFTFFFVLQAFTTRSFFYSLFS